MEMSHGNSLYSYLKQTKVSFFLNKIGEQEGKIGPIWEEVGKGCRRVNVVQILCTHVCKWKNDTC
jgi:hypothetical protein